MKREWKRAHVHLGTTSGHTFFLSRTLDLQSEFCCCTCRHISCATHEHSHRVRALHHVSFGSSSFVCPSIDPLACSDPAQQRQILSDNKIPVHSIPLITPRARKSSALAAGRSSLIVDSLRPPRPPRSISGRRLCAVLSSPTLSAAFGSATSAALVPTSRRHRTSAGPLASGHAANICSRHRRAARHPCTRPRRCRRRLLLACSTYDAAAAAAAAAACRSQLPSMWFNSKA